LNPLERIPGGTGVRGTAVRKIAKAVPQHESRCAVDHREDQMRRAIILEMITRDGVESGARPHLLLPLAARLALDHRAQRVHVRQLDALQRLMRHQRGDDDRDLLLIALSFDHTGQDLLKQTVHIRLQLRPLPTRALGKGADRIQPGRGLPRGSELIEAADRNPASCAASAAVISPGASVQRRRVAMRGSAF
jgi:hypothetical protein